jgi:hypothetical protein
MNRARPPHALPTNGLASAVLEQLNVTQGSAAGDVVALVPLLAGSTVGDLLTITGGSGTLSILEKDLAGGRGHFIFLGSYIPGSGSFTSESPPLPYNPGTVGAIESFTALNAVVTQGDATADVLSVLFNMLTSSTAQLASRFAHRNGRDQAIFQEDVTANGGQLNYQGGSGANRVQADSNRVSGTFDSGPNVANDDLGQDNQNPFLDFVDSGAMFFA